MSDVHIKTCIDTKFVIFLCFGGIKTSFSRKNMNFFPNLTINFNVGDGLDLDEDNLSPERQYTQERQPRTQDNEAQSRSSSSQTQPQNTSLTNVMNRVLRQSIGQFLEDGDMHLFFNIENTTPTPTPTPTQRGMTVEQIYNATVLEICPETHSSQVCSVCQQHLEPSHVIQSISTCHHSFHPVCIGRWLMNNNSCPVCRVQL